MKAFIILIWNTAQVTPSRLTLVTSQCNDFCNCIWNTWVRQCRAASRSPSFFLLFVSSLALQSCDDWCAFHSRLQRELFAWLDRYFFQVIESKFIFSTINVPLHIKSVNILECKELTVKVNIFWLKQNSSIPKALRFKCHNSHYLF